MIREVVIARYHESLEWIGCLAPEVVSTVYNKNADTTRHELATNWVDLENQGREAGTYFEHVIRQYDDLADVTLFCQGDPFAHCYPFVARANDPQLMTWQGEPFLWLSNWMATDDRMGHPNQINLPVGALYDDIFGRQGPDHFEFGAGASFAVRRDLILKKPKSWWENAYRICQERHPEYPWQCERLWAYIFKDPA